MLRAGRIALVNLALVHRFIILGALGFILSSSGCAIRFMNAPSSPTVREARATATEDLRYLTPIPDLTLEAFAQGTPIVTNLQAVIAARAYLKTSRLYFIEDPAVVYLVEEQPGFWQVVFEGDYQVIGPDPEHTITPPAARHGCVLVEFEAKDDWGLHIKTVDCSIWR